MEFYVQKIKSEFTSKKIKCAKFVLGLLEKKEENVIYGTILNKK